MKPPADLIPVNPNNPLYIEVLRDYRHWSQNQSPDRPGMVGQMESHFPCKSAHAVAVYDYDARCWAYIKVMQPEGGRIKWRMIVLTER